MRLYDSGCMCACLCFYGFIGVFQCVSVRLFVCTVVFVCYVIAVLVDLGLGMFLFSGYSLLLYWNW